MADYEDVDIGETIFVEFTTTVTGTGSFSGTYTWTTPKRPKVHRVYPEPPPREVHLAWSPLSAKRMYRALSKRFHPDLNSERIVAGKLDSTPAEWMKLLNTVYDKHDMKTLIVMAQRFCPDSVSG